MESHASYAEACNKKMKMVIMKVIVLVRVIVMRLFRHPPPPPGVFFIFFEREEVNFNYLPQREGSMVQGQVFLKGGGWHFSYLIF